MTVYENKGCFLKVRRLCLPLLNIFNLCNLCNLLLKRLSDQKQSHHCLNRSTLFQRQIDRERTAFSERTFGFDIAIVGFHQGLYIT